LDGLARRGPRPVVGLLHHGFGPVGSDPLDPAWPARFGSYAAEVAGRFPAVRDFLPINEPLTTARFGGLYGWWPPYERDPRAFGALLLAQALAYVEAARVIRARTPGARIIVNEDIGRTFGTGPCRDVVAEHELRRWLTFDLVTGRVDRDHPFWSRLGRTRRHRGVLDRLRSEPEPPDLLGIDHYVTSDRFLDHRLERYPHRSWAQDGRHAYADVELIRVADYPFDGFSRALRDTYARYGLPVALTEVQLAGDPEDQISWWREAVGAARSAAQEGVPVVAVTAWSVFGAYEWASVLRDPCGSYEAGCFDVSTGEPRPTPLATAVRDSSAIAAVPDAVGWWQRNERVLYRPTDDWSTERARAS
jgi:dTDP-4-dehydrorhamnose reductase